MPPPIDIHAARDMTLPGLVSQDLIRQGERRVVGNTQL
jgi:hypothetical protein